MWIVALALRRPYTFTVMAIMILLLGVVTIKRMSTDIFPNIDIPVVSVIWSYPGVPPEEMANRFATITERAMTTTVNDIEHIESQSYSGVTVIKVFFHEGANVEAGVAQVTAISQTLLRTLPPGTTPPLDHPVQRVECADPPDRHHQQGIERGRHRGQRAELPAARPGHGPGSPDAAALRRQDQGGDGRSGFAKALRERPLAHGRGQRARQSKPDPAGGHRKDRRQGILHPAQQQPAGPGNDQRSAGQGGQRRDDIHPRRRPGARRLLGAAKHRHGKRRAGRAVEHFEKRQRIDAGHHRPREGAVAEKCRRRCRHRWC